DLISLTPLIPGYPPIVSRAAPALAESRAPRPALHSVPVLLPAPPSPVQKAPPRDRNAQLLAPVLRARGHLPPRPSAEHCPYSRRADGLYMRLLPPAPLAARPAALAPNAAGQDHELTAAAAGFAPGRDAARAAIRHHRRDHAAGLVRR